jgi:hypothetical protein
MQSIIYTTTLMQRRIPASMKTTPRDAKSSSKSSMDINKPSNAM